MTRPRCAGDPLDDAPGERAGCRRGCSLAVGLVLFVAPVAGRRRCGYVIATGGIDTARRPGGGSETRLVLIGLAALLGALLAAAFGSLLAKASRSSQRTYGAGYDDDMW